MRPLCWLVLLLVATPQLSQTAQSFGPLSSSLQECPTITVDYVDERETKRAFIFKGNISEQNPPRTMTYKWSVHGGEIKEGQGTTSLTVINYKLHGESLTVALEVGGLPKECSNKASISFSH